LKQALILWSRSVPKARSRYERSDGEYHRREPAKLIGTDFFDYFTEPEKARAGYQQVFAKGFVADYPLTIRHTNGKLTDVLFNGSVYKDDRGNVLGVVVVARDITEQKESPPNWWKPKCLRS